MTSLAVAETPPLPVAPLPSGLEDIQRATHGRLRRRLLYGRWDDDLRLIVNQASGTKRADAWRMVDVSANLFRSSMAQLAVQYDRVPYVLHADADGQAFAAQVRRGRYWDTMRRTQRDTLGMRESLIRVDVVKDAAALRAAGPRLLYRQVFADLVTATAHPDDPGRPVKLVETALRDKPDGGTEWTREIWDVTNPTRPRVQVTDASGVDCSPRYLKRADGSRAPEGGLVGEDFGWRDPRSNLPFCPYVIHHAEHTADLWDPYEGRELVAGALNVALMWSFWGHIVRNTAWRQRYGINVEPVAAGEIRDEGPDARKVITGDPAAIWLFRPIDGTEGSAMLGTLEQPADPQVVADAILLYERRIAAFAGISPSDVQRIAGDPRSGFALAISRDGLREAQQQREATFRAGDEEVFAVSAALWAAAGAGSVPLDAYEITYQTLPKTADELAAEQELVLGQLDRGLLDKVTAYQRLNPGTSQAGAVEELTRIELVNGQFASVRPELASALASALLQITSAVTAGDIPGPAAIGILEHSFGISRAAATGIVTAAEDGAAPTEATSVAPTSAPPQPGA